MSLQEVTRENDKFPYFNLPHSVPCM